MSKREVVEVPGALRAEERFAFKEDAKGVEERMKAALKAEAEAPKAAAENAKDALDERADELAERSKMVRERRIQRSRAILGEQETPKAEAVERRPKVKAAAAGKSASGDSTNDEK